MSIRITTQTKYIDPEGWDYPLEELDYLLEEHWGETFCLKDGRLYECDDELIAEDTIKWMRDI